MTLKDWIEFYIEWDEATRECIRVQMEREKLFIRFKQQTGQCKEFGNMSAVESMVLQEIGRAALKERP